MPLWKLGGTVMGERTIEIGGSMIFEDLTNNIKCVCILSTYKKTGYFSNAATGNKDEIVGIIYKSKKLTGDI